MCEDLSLTATQGIDVTVGRLTLLPDWTTLNVLVDLFSPSFWISRAASVLWDWPVYKKCDLKVWIRPLSLESVWSMLWISSVLSLRNLVTNFVGFTNVFSYYLSQVISKQELRVWVCELQSCLYWSLRSGLIFSRLQRFGSEELKLHRTGCMTNNLWHPSHGSTTGNFEKNTLKQQKSMNTDFWSQFRHFGRLLGKICLRNRSVGCPWK